MWLIAVALLLLLRLKTNGITNAFKCYGRAVIVGVQPLPSHHFNLTVELPLKAIIRGYSYAVLPNAWYDRNVGISKLCIREKGSRYHLLLHRAPHIAGRLPSPQ